MRWLGNIAAVALLTMSATALAGCVSGTHTVAADVSPEGWSEPVVLTYDNGDTLRVVDLTLSLRHSARISPSGGGFRIARLSPWGELTVDTLGIHIFPIVSHTGRLRETTAEADSRLRLARAGEWRFTVTPLQRMQGVWSVAIELK